MKRNYRANSDRELVDLVRQGAAEAEPAFTELYHRYSSSVHSYCLRVLSNETAAEDIFQETFIKFYHNVRTDLNDFNVAGFIIKIARNLCLNYKRDMKANVSIDDVNTLVNQENYEKKELLELINNSLELIDDDLRECFVLKEYSGLQYTEIAEVLNITVVNAKTRVFRAKQKIKNILEPYLKEFAENN